MLELRRVKYCMRMGTHDTLFGQGGFESYDALLHLVGSSNPHLVSSSQRMMSLMGARTAARLRLEIVLLLPLYVPLEASSPSKHS